MTQECTIDKIKKDLSDLKSQLDGIPQSTKAIVPSDSQSQLTQPKETSVVDKNEQPVEEKRPSSSWWGWVRETFKKGFKVTSNHASDSGGSQGGSGKSRRGQDQADADLEIKKLQSDIHQMTDAFEKLTHFQSNISESLKNEVPSNKLKAILDKTDSVKSRALDIKEIRRKVLNLKGQIPSLLKKQSSIGLSITDSQIAKETGEIVETGSDISLAGLHMSCDYIKSSQTFEEVVEKFEVLEFREKLCLLSLAVFPENKEVKRTMLMYWWIGEGFISDEDSENTVTRILDEFSRNRLLEPVEYERKRKPSSYKMEPHVHSAIIYLARGMELFDLYDPKGNLIMKKSKKQQVCLVRGSSLLPEAKTSKMEPKTLKSVFNSSERYPDFTFRWFPQMESLKVLYLGRWERTPTRHIEVESTEFLLKDMKSLKSLRLASFQGISRIENLNDLSCSLPKLVILDLRACYNLEVLPDDIGSLKSLIYLDVSECYMLDRMPQGILGLKKLQVLKGFVISQSDDEKNCAVKHLENLRKLSITVNRYSFKVEDFMESLKGLKQLESLKISWGARFPDEAKEKQRGEEKPTDPKEDLESLKSDKVVEGKADQEEGKKHDEESLKSEKKAGTIQNDEEGKSKVAGDGDKGKAATTEEVKKQEKVDTEKTRSENGVKKASPSSESKNKQEEKGDGEKGKVNLEEAKKKDESSRPDKVMEGDKKTSPPQESKDTVKSKPDDQEEKGDGEKDKIEQVKKKDEVKAESLKPDKKTSPPQESKDTVKSKPDDQEEKGDGEKDKIEQVKKKADKVIMEGDKKTSPPQESKDKVQEKGDGEKIKPALKKPDGGEAMTHKNKLVKKVSFPEEPKAPIQKTPGDMKKDSAMDKENHESRSKNTATKESGSIFAKRLTFKTHETKKPRKGGQEDSGIDTSKLPSSLRKLQLECYPENEPPTWLNPKRLDKLEKLSIKGGNLTRFSDKPSDAENKCGVQILRLKYLHEFKAEWKDLQALFPKLQLLEKYKCPDVAFCPTDGNGVWRSQP